MRFLIRADASQSIGTGHVVRCATLARQLTAAGHDVLFLCRRAPGDLVGWLEAQGLPVTPLPSGDHDQSQDAAACCDLAGPSRYDWLIVDHYALDEVWESAMTNIAGRVLAIDDLGRAHACDLLLDQNFASPAHDLYPAKVPARCQFLFGPDFALVRPEFAVLRAKSLAKSRQRLSRLLVFMGGSDPVGETTKVVNGIALASLADLAVDVVIGSSNPHRAVVERACKQLPDVALHVQTSEMAALMARADCAVGAAGSTTWERCTLGLPALVTILAENQTQIAEKVAASGGHRLLGRYDDLSPDAYARALTELTPNSLNAMSTAAATLCDGEGAKRVAARLVMERIDAHISAGRCHA
jgi:UDP-2,4-diacetamido-2,4,6-trideoxy-beta-L-altropyranose hydrolase